MFFGKFGEKEGEKVALGLSMARPKHLKGSQGARCGNWPLSEARTVSRAEAVGRVGRGSPSLGLEGEEGRGSGSRIYTP